MMVQSSFYSDEELLSMGFKSIGKGCMISRKASFYGVGRMSIGNNVRIDDFCILSGSITLANNIHISAYVALYGAEGIEFEDYTGISARSTIYSAILVLQAVKLPSRLIRRLEPMYLYSQILQLERVVW